MIKIITAFLKESLDTLGRHVLTFIPGLVVFLKTHGLIGEGQAEVVTEDLVTSAENLWAVLAVVITRLVMRLWGKYFAKAATHGGNATGLAVLLGVALPAFAALSLVSCSTEHGMATPGWYATSSPMDPEARFGLLLEARVPGLRGRNGAEPPPIVEVRGEK